MELTKTSVSYIDPLYTIQCSSSMKHCTKERSVFIILIVDIIILMKEISVSYIDPPDTIQGL